MRKIMFSLCLVLTTSYIGLAPIYVPTGSGAADDTAYNATTWDGVTTVSPSKNAVRDKLVTFAPIASNSTWFTLATPGVSEPFGLFLDLVVGDDSHTKVVLGRVSADSTTSIVSLFKEGVMVDDQFHFVKIIATGGESGVPNILLDTTGGVSLQLGDGTHTPFFQITSQEIILNSTHVRPTGLVACDDAAVIPGDICVDHTNFNALKIAE